MRVKKLLYSLFVFVLIINSDIYSQSQEIDANIAELFKDIPGSCEFIKTMNYYFSIEQLKEINKEEFDEFSKISRDVNKKNIPTYETRINKKSIELYFKKGKTVYFFSLEKKDNLYFSTVKLYTFKSRKVKGEGRMAFKP